MTPQDRRQATDLLSRHGISLVGADGPAGGRGAGGPRRIRATRTTPRPPAPAPELDDPFSLLYNMGIE